MHKGDISGKADMSDFENYKHLYAIGALENLKGEIQIIDGESLTLSYWIVQSVLISHLIEKPHYWYMPKLRLGIPMRLQMT